jgi:hypothetical protein
MSKPRGKPFPKGCSGNPGGKLKNPKAIRDRQVMADVKELSRLEGPEAVRQLAAIMKDERAPHAARVSAANSLLDRGYGRPAQSVDVTANVSPGAVLAPERARDIIARRLATIAERIEAERDGTPEQKFGAENQDGGAALH